MYLIFHFSGLPTEEAVKAVYTKSMFPKVCPMEH